MSTNYASCLVSPQCSCALPLPCHLSKLVFLAADLTSKEQRRQVCSKQVWWCGKEREEEELKKITKENNYDRTGLEHYSNLPGPFTARPTLNHLGHTLGRRSLFCAHLLHPFCFTSQEERERGDCLVLPQQHLSTLTDCVLCTSSSNFIFVLQLIIITILVPTCPVVLKIVHTPTNVYH